MRVLIVRIGAMGDVLHALPAVAALRRAEPAADIGWAIDPRWAPLLQGRPEPAFAADPAPERASIATDRLGTLLPIADRLHLVPTRAWKRAPLSSATGRSILALRRELRGPDYTVTVDLQGTLRSAVVGSLAGAPLFLGSADPRERPVRYLYRQMLLTPAEHVIDQALELLRGLTEHTLMADPQAIRLPRERTAELWCDRQLGTPGGPVVVLAPTAGWGAKMWPAERFGQLARALAAQGCTVVVNSAGPLDHVARDVVASAGGAARGFTSTLPELIALLRRASLAIAGDTGPLHLAAALGRPVVALFGPTNPARTGPRGSRARVLRDPRSITDHSRRRAPEAGLLRLGVDDVLHAALDLLHPEVLLDPEGLPGSAPGMPRPPSPPADRPPNHPPGPSSAPSSRSAGPIRVPERRRAGPRS